MLERSTLGMFTLALHVNVSQAFFTAVMHSTGNGFSAFFVVYLADASEADEIDVEALLESLEKKVDQSSTTPNCITSKV